MAYSLSNENINSITTSFDYEGDDSIIRELMMIDLEEWKIPGPFTLSLTVTDHISGMTESRSIDFDYVE